MITEPELEELLRHPESDRVELTRSHTDTNKFCEAICAFSNDMPNHRKPGYLILGVNERGEAEGAAITDQLLQNLAAHRDNGQIIPQPSMHVARLRIGGKDVAVVEVMPSTQPPVRYKGVTHVRVGPRRATATIDDERRLSEKRVSRALTWDARANEFAAINDMVMEQFQLTYLPAAVAPEVLAENQRTPQEQLAGLRLFDPSAGRPTNAAVLLFSKDPLALVPGAFIQYVRYSGLTQGANVSQEQRISANLVDGLREMKLLAMRLADAKPVRQADLTDATVYAYPPIALHELFMNAVIHRNYENSTTPVFINQFSDRIEIQNPGSLYGELTREQFPRGASYRNPVLAEAAKTLGYANRFGRGIAIAQAELARNASPPAEFPFSDNFFLAVVRARP